jgi:hypothetical protein
MCHQILTVFLIVNYVKHHVNNKCQHEYVIIVSVICQYETCVLVINNIMFKISINENKKIKKGTSYLV